MSPTGSLVDVGAAVAPCVLKGFGSLESEGEREAGEWPLLVLAARGLCLLTPAATFRIRTGTWGWGGVGVRVGEHPSVQGLIENRDEFIKFSFVWG